MTPRTILYTGKGGVGKTSVAAATARRCAAAGGRTLVLSTDPAHSLAESLETPVGSAPTEVGDGLWAQQVQAQEEMERHWSAVADWMGELLVERGVNRITAEELAVPPGLDELFSLLQLKRHHESGEWDAIVVDCAPTGETLRLLSFPDVARWWLDKVFPHERQLLAAARPIARTMLDVTLPSEAVFADVQRLMDSLIAMNEILRDRAHATIRLVMNPDKMVIGEAMRTFTYLNLYGYLTDAVIVNRVFPDEVAGTYFGAWRERQQEHLELVDSAFSPVPVLRAPYFDSEVVGPEMLDRLGDALFEHRDAAAVLHDALSHELRVGEGEASLRLDLPFAERGDIALKKIGLELVVRVDGQKRTIMLPPALAHWRATEARFEDGALQVTLDEHSPPTG
ncbi:MAG: arsenite/tail-anchored protein-transporting ATPase [Solirubrobacteraceae bacterium]|jgi:arsenite-transporting ATPase|nr:arsenite/tail-anchored protein-transporting ATPase [Solirubrobacteraceae bacterium]